jgi:GTP cyclohydrolase II
MFVIAQSRGDPLRRASTARAARYSEASVPTAYGVYQVVVYRELGSPHIEHCAFVRGEVAGAEDLWVRVHSECFTGEVLHSLKCDCREQLAHALEVIALREHGVVVYLRQEGRGIGLGNKIRAYALQAQGVDTVDANLRLGFATDARDYGIAAQILSDLGVSSVALLTNNPTKLRGLCESGTRVTRRVPVEVQSNPHNHEYLNVKRARMGHLIPLEPGSSAATGIRVEPGDNFDAR